MNQLYYNDNLDVLESFSDNSIDLVYTDPPFNTGKDWGAFNDKWEKGLAGYLDFIRPRIEEIHRILKDTGSFYLHCDPTASHYLKVLCDQIFGITNFQNEIVWCYSSPGYGSKSRKFNKKHDILFFYSNGGRWVFDPDSVRIPHEHGKLHDGGFFNFGGKSMTDPYYENLGKVPETWWKDIAQAYKCAKQNLKYPTQKPIALLERVINASSNKNDVVLDPFCGSGTTLDAAHKLERNWIGIDEGEQAIETTTFRLADRHGLLPNDDYELIGGIENIELPTPADATPQQTKLF